MSTERKLLKSAQDALHEAMVAVDAALLRVDARDDEALSPIATVLPFATQAAHDEAEGIDRHHREHGA